MAWDANWVGVYVQAAATVIAAVAAGLACWTTKTAKDISERQTALGAIQDLAKDYSGPEMFDALRRFGTLSGAIRITGQGLIGSPNASGRDSQNSTLKPKNTMTLRGL